MPNHYYISEIPEVVAAIKERFATVAGIKRVDINIRVLNTVIVYIFIDKSAAESCESDMVLPEEVGIRYEKTEMNLRRFPRLWLAERRAELQSEQAVAKLQPHLYLEFVIFLQPIRSGTIVVV